MTRCDYLCFIQLGVFARRPSNRTPRRRHEFLDPHPLERMNNLLQLGCQRPHVVAQYGKQGVLNDVPALHDQRAFGSIRGRALWCLAW